MSWEDVALDAAVRDTEKEIFSEAVQTEGPDEREDNRQLVEDLSQSESWDGNILSDEEIANRNLHGDSDTGMDRQLAMEDELTLQAENEALRQQLGQRDQYINSYIAQPISEAQQAQQREQVRHVLQERYGLFDVSDEGVDRFAADVAVDRQHSHNLEEARANASFGHAHAQYGPDFERAYADITTMNPSDPLAQQIVRGIMSSADPGESLMRYHDSHIVQSLGTGRAPPFMPQSMRGGGGRRSAAPRGRSSSAENMNSGWGDRGTEEDVFNSAFDQGWDD